MSRIVMVRHGETVWHAENRYAGRSDIELTERGLTQAQCFAAWVRESEITSVWSSPLSRAQFTAHPAAEALGLPFRIEERFIELDFGQGEGLTSKEMQQRFPEALAAFRLDPVRHFLPGGEDPVCAVERAFAALYSIAASVDAEGRVLVVAHNTLLRLVLCKMLGIPLSRYRAVFPRFDNCTLTEVSLAPDRAIALLSFNAPLFCPATR